MKRKRREGEREVNVIVRWNRRGEKWSRNRPRLEYYYNEHVNAVRVRNTG